MKRVIVGTGTGRCGTKSLAHILGRQEGFLATHEKVGGMHRDGADGKVEAFWDYALDSGAEVVCDVSPCWVYNWQRLFDLCVGRGVQFDLVWLERPRAEYVASAMRHSACDSAPMGHRDHFLNNPEAYGYSRPPEGWGEAFPKYDDLAGLPIQARFLQWWNDCRMVARGLNVPTHSLGSEGSVAAMLYKLGVEGPVVETARHSW